MRSGLRLFFGLVLAVLLAEEVRSQACEYNYTATNYQEVPDWTYISVTLHFDGVIQIKGSGSNLGSTTIQTFTSGVSQAEADSVLIALRENTLGAVFVNITDTVSGDPNPSDFSPEDSSSRLLSPNFVGMGLALGMAHPRTRVLSILAASSLLVSKVSSDAACPVNVTVVITVPDDLAIDLGLTPGETREIPTVNSYAKFEFGAQSIPACNGTGICESSNVQCRVNNVVGECKDRSVCAAPARAVAGFCPGAANIQCCVDDAPACTLSSGVRGNCRSTTTCSSIGGTSTPGFCQGASNIQCCTRPLCTANGRQGVCESTTTCSARGGTSTAGLCPGASNIQCCTTGTSNPPPASGGFTAPQPRQVLSVPFAPMSGVFWPLRQSSSSRAIICYENSAGSTIQVPSSPTASNSGCSVRKFLAGRDGGSRYHSGIDLYAPAGTAVVATESGRIVNAYRFFENVCCVIQQTDSGITINYGEISCNYVVSVGQRVSAGQLIGYVGDLQCCQAMLHFEIYTGGVTQNLASRPGDIRSQLRNPTRYLLALRENGRSA